MREYTRLEAGFWVGATGKELRRYGPETQLLALYLISSPHSNMLGLYHLPLAYLSSDTGLSPEEASRCLHNLAAANFCAYDHNTECVWVFQMARFQVGIQLKERDLRAEGIRREYRSLPENPFLSIFFDRYADAFHLKERRNSPAGERPTAPPLLSLASPPSIGARVDSRAPTVCVAVGDTLRSQTAEEGANAMARDAVAHGNVLVLTSPQLDLGCDPAPSNRQKSATPDCPHDLIIALYHELLPSCSPVVIWNEQRKALLRARWREERKRQNEAWWRKFFSFVAESDFLCGRVTPREGRTFVADLEWLIRPTNFVKVVEGKYHEGV